jgi:hypothetical protein
VAGEKRFEVFAHADRADAGSAAAVGDAEGLVQVQVRDVGAELAGRGDADQRVQIGAVQVDLAAVPMNDFADFADVLLEHAVRRRVGDHQRAQAVGVLGRPGLQVLQVHVAVVVALDHDDLHAGHRRAGRVGAVGRRGDEADVALRVAARFMVGLDGQQPRVLAL